MTTTDTPKRDESLAETGLLLKQAEVAALEWLNCDRYSKRLGPVSALPDCDDTNGRKNIALRMLRAVRDANFSTPPSQGKVERALEIILECWKSHHIDDANAVRTGTSTYLIPLKYVIAAITQALTESSGQGTDGACCEAMREKAAKVVIGWRECDWPEGFDRRTAELMAQDRAERIRALPLPVSADGSAQDRREKALTIVTILANTPVEGWLSRKDIHAALAEFNPKQPSDTGAGK